MAFSSIFTNYRHFGHEDELKSRSNHKIRTQRPEFAPETLFSENLRKFIFLKFFCQNWLMAHQESKGQKVPFLGSFLKIQKVRIWGKNRFPEQKPDVFVTLRRFWSFEILTPKSQLFQKFSPKNFSCTTENPGPEP